MMNFEPQSECSYTMVDKPIAEGGSSMGDETTPNEKSFPTQ